VHEGIAMVQKEIEAKVRVTEPTILHETLQSIGAQFIREYTKSDRYWRLTLPDTTFLDIRIRQDDNQTCMTFKDRTSVGTHQGIENSTEYETQVSKSSVIETLLIRLQAQPLITKIKKGFAWRYKNALLELSEVESLGWFLEIEYLLEIDEQARDSKPDEGSLSIENQAHDSILNILSTLGFTESDLEHQTYTSLLLAVKNSGQSSIKSS
jgi:adenylate cyclase class 2